MIDYLVSHVLRNFIDYDDRAGKKYFATDFSGVIDLRNDPRPDIVLFENIETEEDLKEARRIVGRANMGARFFVPYGSDIMSGIRLGSQQKAFTYSLDDPEANFYAYRTEKTDDGNLTVNVIYQPNYNERRSLKERLFVQKDTSITVRFRLPYEDESDVLNLVKTFAFGLSLSLETKYIIGAVDSLRAGDAPADTAKNTAGSSRDSGTAGRRRKEADFD